MHREAEWSNAPDKTVQQKQRELIKRQSHVDRARTICCQKMYMGCNTRGFC